MFTEPAIPVRVTAMVGPTALRHLAGSARRPARRRLAAVAATLVLGASSCGGGDDQAAETTTTTQAPTTALSTTQPATTTTEPLTPEEEVEAAYLAAMAVFYDVSRSPDPDDERLPETMIEPNLTVIRDVMATAQQDGIYVRYPDDQPPAPEILTLEVDGDVAALTVCVIDDAQQVRRSDDRVVDDDVISRFIEVSMEKVDDSWKISDSLISGRWQDGAGCDR